MEMASSFFKFRRRKRRPKKSTSTSRMRALRERRQVTHDAIYFFLPKASSMALRHFAVETGLSLSDALVRIVDAHFNKSR